jgi:hypothetical protein
MAATRWRHKALATSRDAAVFWLLRDTRMLCPCCKASIPIRGAARDCRMLRHCTTIGCARMTDMMLTIFSGKNTGEEQKRRHVGCENGDKQTRNKRNVVSHPSLPDFRRSIAWWKAPRRRPVCLSGDGKFRSVGGN